MPEGAHVQPGAEDPDDRSDDEDLEADLPGRLSGDEQERGGDEDCQEYDDGLQGALGDAGQCEDTCHVDGQPDEDEPHEGSRGPDLCGEEAVPDCRGAARPSALESLSLRSLVVDGDRVQEG